MHHNRFDSPTFVEIDISAYRHNMAEIKKKLSIKTGIITVVKADAYGHGSAVIAKEAINLGTSMLAVARFYEAVKIRQEGIDCPILLFGYCDTTDISEYFRYNIRPTINTQEDAERLSERCSSVGEEIAVHVKVDTGMGRHGLCMTENEIIKSIQKIYEMPNIKIEGIYSHFANADASDKTHAQSQIDKFERIRSKLNEIYGNKFIYHMANSAGIMDLPQSHYDLVRPGIITYGLYPSDETLNSSIDLHPVMSFKSRVTQVKKVGPGFSVSYGSTFITERETVIATVPVGYADGYSRLLSSKGEMLVRGKRAKVIGRVCMDLTMLDVTHIPEVRQDDEVVIFGSQEDEFISANELADKIGTINYEIVCMISDRVPRIYINE